MKKTKGNFIFHVLAFLTMALWGVTFISTKTLINQGLTHCLVRSKGRHAAGPNL